MSCKRKDYIDWDSYFMGIAILSGQRSKDPSTQVGACIVSKDNKILSVGYNGAPNGYDDDNMPWEREGTFLETKYAYVCHAELNAILNNKGSNLEGARIYDLDSRPVAIKQWYELANIRAYFELFDRNREKFLNQ